MIWGSLRQPMHVILIVTMTLGPLWQDDPNGPICLGSWKPAGGNYVKNCCFLLYLLASASMSMQKMSFFKKKLKEHFFFPACQWPHRDAKALVSEGRIVCFSHRFFWRPTTITIRRSGAVRSVSGRTTPPYTIRVAQKSNMAKPYTSARKVFFYATGPQKLSSRSNESSNFMFSYKFR